MQRHKLRIHLLKIHRSRCQFVETTMLPHHLQWLSWILLLCLIKFYVYAQRPVTYIEHLILFFNLKITNRSFKWTFNICTFIFSSCAYFFFLLAHFHLIIFLLKPHLQKSSMCLHMKTRLFILSIVAITCQQIRVMPPCCLRKPHNEMVKKTTAAGYQLRQVMLGFSFLKITFYI